jgi:chromate transporter
MAAIAALLPPNLIVIAGAPTIAALQKNLQVKPFIQGVTATAEGGIEGAAFILGRRSLIDLQTVSIALTTFGLLGFKKIPESFLILAAGMVGPPLFKG